MDKYVGDYKGYKIYISNKYPKKYYAIVNQKKVYFGDIRYQHFFDKMGVYSFLNHYDKKRRKLFKIRHEKNRHKKGTAAWFSDQILWS